MDIIKNAVKQITSLLLQLYANEQLLLIAISLIVLLIIVCVVFLSVLKHKKKAIKYIEDSKFSIIEEISFSQSSEIIM